MSKTKSKEQPCCIPEEIIGIWTASTRIKAFYTARHQQRVAVLSCIIAEKMGLPTDKANGLRMAALTHDIGKIGIPDKILNKPGKLTDIEFNTIKAHPTLGYTMLENIDFGYPVAQIVHQHHERIDGSGYPQGLKDKEILPEAKILAVADVFDAMTSDRPYRPAIGTVKVLFMILKDSNTLYDFRAVDALIRVIGGKQLVRGFDFG